jgi:peptidoglycan hydrolase-like protein with peptidoglycan-binding domain
MRLTKSHVVSGVLAIALLGATGTAWYFAAQARTPAQRAEETAEPDDSVITVRVDQDQLISTLDFDAELNRTGDFKVTAPTAPEGAAAALASKIPVKTGDEVNPGTVLLEVSGRPMIALEGDVPAYRDLKEGDSGPDVEQLQLALQQIYGTPKTGTFDSRTASDLKKLYDHAGYDHAVESEEIPDENTDPGTDGEGDPEGEGDQPPAGNGQATTVDRVALPASEVVFLPDLPMQVGKIDAKQSAPVEGTVMTLASGDWKLEAKLDENIASELNKLGDEAQLEYGSGPLKGLEVGAFELDVREEEGESDDGGYNGGGDGEAPTVEVTYAVFEFNADEIEGIDDLAPGEKQEVTLVLARSAEDALIVPLSALWTDGEGRTMVTVLDDDNKERHVEVAVPLRHDGRGVVEPVEDELAEGDEVVIAWRDRGNG